VGATDYMPTPIEPGRRSEPPRVGLIAGWGQYPLVVAEALKRRGCRTFCLGVVGHADPRLADVCDDFRWAGLARFGRAIRYFRHNQVTRATMAGKIFKTLLFRRGGWIRHLPDLRTVRMFIPHFLTRRKDLRDDTILRTIVDEFASGGIRFGPATDYAPELLVVEGQLTRRAPSPAQWKDVEFGWKIAKELGRLDVGQSVAVKDQAALAVEAIEGTDECIRRAGRLCKAGRFTVVKTSKPQQDMRFDVPTVGIGTLQTLVEARASVLAVEAGKTIVLDQPQFVELANRHKLAVVALQTADARPGTKTPAEVEAA
jgi:UDP-2,3-diacylglucosamine hydrolase